MINHSLASCKSAADKPQFLCLVGTQSEMVHFSNSAAKTTCIQNVSIISNLNIVCVDIIFLKGLYFEKVVDKNKMYGFTLYHDSDSFRRRMLFHKDEAVVDQWIQRLRYHCQFFDIKEFYDHKEMPKLGGGKFSEVVRVTNRRTKKTYALKKIDKTRLNAKEKEFLRDEIQIVSLLSHTNVTEMREYYYNPRWMWIVMEQVHGGDL